ncbi:MAG: anthranilate synthase component I family protein [Bacteroidales bacterium]
MKIRLHTKGKKMLADLQTPISIYLKLRDLYPQSVLLESSDSRGNENSISIIGIEPIAFFKLENNIVTENYGKNLTKQYELNAEDRITDKFYQFTKCFEVDEQEEMNGFFGFTSFNAVRYFEPSLPQNVKSTDLSVPDIYYLLYKYILVINHYKNELTLLENLYENEESEMDRIESLLCNRNFATYSFKTVGNELSTTSPEEYLKMVEKGIEHCNRGDVFQIVLSRRFKQSYQGDDFMVYRSLRSVNPSPYLFYFDFGSFRIFGSSPETHCRIQNGSVYIDPIAGTFKRTGIPDQDEELGRQLLKDPKENAEHVMLVDLARNDLSRNATNVSIDFFKEVHFYSHVIHLVSRVRGQLGADVNSIKVFADSFPAGTLSGAPKIRAMELINGLEKHDRGAYGGCIGYIGFNGNLNQAITIRTFVSKDNNLYYQAGAGVVSKSDPQSELQEVNNKLGALKKAIDQAETIH